MEYRNPKALANGWIECEINHPDFGWIPFACDPEDKGANFDVAALHAEMSADPNLPPYVPPTPEELEAVAAAEVRRQRDYLLVTEVDPVVTNPLRWADMAEDKREAYRTYRRILLDVPEQAGFPFEVVWPDKPV